MFFGGREDPKFNNGYGPGNTGITLSTTMESLSDRSLGCWLSMIVPNIFYFLALVSNLICFIIMVIKSQCTFTTPQNLLMMAFLLTMAYYSLNNMVCSISGEIMGMTANDMAMGINQIGDIFSSYFSIILLFLIGMNRAAVYTNPWLVKNFFPRKRLIVFLIIMALLSLLISLVVFKKAGMTRSKDSEGMYNDYVSNLTLMTISSYVAYGIALSSCLFYARVYFHLRSQRDGVTHDKTKELLDKAELMNCRQGVFVLSIYSFSLVSFILSETVQQNDWQLVIHAVQKTVQSLPSLAIPLSLLCFCREMQSVLKYMLTGGKKGKKCKNSRSSADSNGRRSTVTAMSTITSF